MAECADLEPAMPSAAMNRRLSVAHVSILGLILILSAPAADAAVPDPVLYVGPREGGVWFAPTPTPAPNQRGLLTGTLADALQAARTLKTNSGSASQVTVQLRGGRYELPAPIVLTSADSGLTLAAYRNERPILSGARRLRGWTLIPDRPGAWQTQLPSDPGNPPACRSLFNRDRRLPRARTPNNGFFRIDGASPDRSPSQFLFRGTELLPNFVTDPRAEIVAWLGWTSFRLPLVSVDPTNHLAKLGGIVRTTNREADARYYLENSPAALDAPGEWYANTNGILTYLALPGEGLEEADLRASQLETLLVVRGETNGNEVARNIRLRGLTFTETDWSLPPEGEADMQAAHTSRAAVHFNGAVDCVVEACSFLRLSGYAIELGHGCRRDQIVGCEFAHLGAGGIRIGEAVASTSPDDDVSEHLVTDNRLHHLGEVWPGGVGILIRQSGTNRIVHNEIHHTAYTGIAVGWTWGYHESPCRENEIAGNHLHDIGQARLSDLGAIYTLGPQPGTRIHHNLIHDVASFTYGGWGIYTDEGSSGIVIENNLVFRTTGGAFHQHLGRDNQVRNNIFALNRDFQIARTGYDREHAFVLTRNLVYFACDGLLGGDWRDDRFTMDRNLYWDARRAAGPDTLRFVSDTLEAWQARGHDQHSLVADPRFIAPEAGDFRLRDDSPAHEIGFEPFDVRDAGVRPPWRESPPARP